MAKKIQTITTCTCDLCGNECAEAEGTVEIQIDGGDGRDVGPGFIRGCFAVFLPYGVDGVDGGEVCRTCLLKWLGVYVKNQGMA